MRRKWYNVFYEGDGGAAGGGEGGTDGTGGGTGGSGDSGGAGSQPAARPAWFSQLSKDDEKTYGGQLSQFSKISDLAKAYVDLKAHPVEKEGAVYVPGEGASEEDVKKFRTALGIPDSYELADDGSMYTHDGKENASAKKAWEAMKAQVAQLAKENNMTKAQAQKVWDHQIAFLKAGMEAQTAQRKNLEQTFGARVDNLYRKDIPNETERRQAIKSDFAVIRRSLKETPALRQALESSGILLNPAVAREMATYLKSIGGGRDAGGSGQGVAPPKPKNDGGLTFSKEFYDHIKEIKNARS